MVKYDFKEKVVIITGSGGGMGRTIALEYAKAGADVVVADINEEKAKAVAEEIKKLGVRSLGLKVDVSSSEDISDMVKACVNELGTVDILVNNAGIANRASIYDLTEKQWDMAMDINVKSMWLTSKEVLPVMSEKKSGRIVNMGSITGKDGGILIGIDYAVSKAGVHVLTKRLASDTADLGITVNAVAPHAIRTPMTAGHGKESMEGLLARIPVHRLGEPKEVADLIMFLSSDEAGFITGQTVHINGGTLMVD